MLVAKNIHKTFRRGRQETKALDGVSLEIKQGETFGLVGESGCGKSTLSRIILQLIAPSSGEIFLEGKNVTALSKRELLPMRRNFQMIFQDPYASLNPRMTVQGTLLEALATQSPKPDENSLQKKLNTLLEQVGLSRAVLQKYPHEFSGGQRQRIAIARALAPEPKLLIADEPVSALDVSIQSQILNLLLDLQKNFSLTMLFISHDLNVVRYLAERIAVMQAGKIVETGLVEKIFTTPEKEYTKTLLAAAPTLAPEATPFKKP